jgi:hypothetical protein
MKHESFILYLLIPAVLEDFEGWYGMYIYGNFVQAYQSSLRKRAAFKGR